MVAYNSSWQTVAHHGGLKLIMAAYSSSWRPTAPHGSLQLLTVEWRGRLWSLLSADTPGFTEVQGAVKGLFVPHMKSSVGCCDLRDLSYAEVKPLPSSPTHFLFPFAPLCLPSWLCSLFAWPACNIEPSFTQHSPPQRSLSLFLLFQSCPRWQEISLAQRRAPTTIIACHSLLNSSWMYCLALWSLCFLLICPVLSVIVIYHEYTLMMSIPNLLHDSGWVGQSKRYRCWAVSQWVQKWELSWCASLWGHMVPDFQRCWRQLTGPPYASHSYVMHLQW